MDEQKEVNFRFIHEMPLKVSSKDALILNKRLNAARNLYNACLGHCLKSIKLIRESKDWQKAYILHKSSQKADKKQSKILFKRAKEKYCYSEYQLHKVAKEIAQQCFINLHLDSLTIQKVATRAYDASEKYYYGKRGRPRFKSFKRFNSIEGKNNASGLRFKDGHVIWNVKNGKKLALTPLYDLKDKHEVESHALSCEIKYIRLVKSSIKGKFLWYVQLILSGVPKQKEKNKHNVGEVGLDIGPSTIAIVSKKYAKLTSFCDGLKNCHEKIKKLNKKMDRSRRLNNPDNYNEDKTCKSGFKIWYHSNRYKKLKAQLATEYYKMEKTRKKLHGELINYLLSLGNVFKTEKLSYKSFQKNFGKSIGMRAPGKFIEKLYRKAASANGKVIEFSTYNTKLSQSCHCGRPHNKKKLSERWHKCECGVIAQRDLYSAFLALYVKDNSLNTHQASLAWSVVEPLLGRAVLRLEEQASSENSFASFGINQRQSLSHAKEKLDQAKIKDVVG